MTMRGNYKEWTHLGMPTFNNDLNTIPRNGIDAQIEIELILYVCGEPCGHGQRSCHDQICASHTELKKTMEILKYPNPNYFESQK